VSWIVPLQKVGLRRIRHGAERYKRVELASGWVEVLLVLLAPPRGLRTRCGYSEDNGVESESSTTDKGNVSGEKGVMEHVYIPW
jgi:hypothetical protein